MLNRFTSPNKMTEKTKNILIALLLISLTTHFGCSKVEEEPVFMGNGIKIGEVSQTTAIIWTRITKSAEAAIDGVPFLAKDRNDRQKFAGYTNEELSPENGYGYQLSPGVQLEEAQYALAGTSGEVRLSYQEGESKETTDWQPVDPISDFTKHFSLEGLKAGTEYQLTVEARKGNSGRATATMTGSFSTAPAKDEFQSITFTVATCTKFETRDAGELGHHLYDSILKMKPDFFVHAGDILYYDSMPAYASHIDMARFKWNRMFSLPNLRALLREVPSYWMKDDHDSWDNDSWPTMPPEMGLFTYEEGKKVFDEQVPMSDKRHYRTFRWGKDLQIWMVEVRDHRSPNFYPDGPEKTMWGNEQIDWFKQTVEASDATFKILISPTPMVGPDHLWKGEMHDNHADKGWSHEGDMLREYIASQKNMYYVCGDRHWQYISQHPATGMIEYAAGGSTDKHAIFMANDDTSMHLYYGPDKGGYLSVTIDREEGVPTARFRHHGVMGELFNEDVRVSVQ